MRHAIRGHIVLVVLLLVWTAPRASAQPDDALEKGLRLQHKEEGREARARRSLHLSTVDALRVDG